MPSVFHDPDQPVFHGDHDDHGGPQGLLITEGADAAENASTAYRIDVGDTFRGTISNVEDEDWIAVTLTAGETYQINMTGVTLSDPFVRLYDSSGNLVAFNDDFGGSLDSRISSFTADRTGTYYIEADAYSTQTGTYDIEIDEVAPPDPAAFGTLDDLALFLSEGYWGGREFTFDTSSSNVITMNLSGLTAAGQQLARWATAAWEAVANLDFVEVNSGEMLTFDDESGGAYAYSPGGSGPDGVEINIARSWLTNNGTTIDSYSFQTYVHEIGHAIGLGHQGNYNGNASYGADETFTNDSWQVSVMSYFSQTENTLINASYGYTAGPMMADILAIQNLYGAPAANTATSGDTTYGAGSTVGNYMDQVFAWMATGVTTANVNGNSMVFTLYDRSGIDTLDMNYLAVNARLDLRAEQFSDFGARIGVMGIARDTVIEDAVLGSGNDTVTGNDANNRIVLGTGDDLANGGAGFDTLMGGNGEDSLIGGDGADSLYGDAGNDRLEGGQGFDQLYGGAGNDTLITGDNADRAYGGDGNDLIRGGSNLGLTVDGLFGEAGDDTIYGDGGFDLIDGGTGNDLLDGGGQADNIYGRDGQDTLLGGGGLDRLFGGNDDDSLNGGEGNDGLFGEAGNDILVGGSGNDNFFGGQGNDLILGGSGNDTINGGAGFDMIEGGTGNDLMLGRFNADTFVFANGHGNDTVGDFSAGNQFERLDISAISAIGDISDLQVGNPNGGAAQQVGSDVVIDTGGGNSITLTGVDLTDLDATNFIF